MEVLSSSMEAYFDFDTQEGDEPAASTGRNALHFAYRTMLSGKPISCGAVFDFWFERSWQDYYDGAQLTPVASRRSLTSRTRHHRNRHPCGIGVLPASFNPAKFATRPLMLERLNRARSKLGKARLLDQIEVFSPLLPEYCPSDRRFVGHPPARVATSPRARPPRSTRQSNLLAGSAFARECPLWSNSSANGDVDH